MGCGASKDPKIGVSDSIKPVKTNNSSSNNLSRSNNNNKKNNSSYNDPRNLPDTKNVPAPLAFVISFDDNNTNNEVRRPPPGRLRLEPINNNKHKLTKDELDDKMRAAEHNREKILAERAKSSGTKKRTPNHSNYSSDRNDSDLNFKDENNFGKKRGGGGSDARMNGDYERNDDNKQRLLKNRRIVQQPDDNDDLDLNSKYNNRRDDGNKNNPQSKNGRNNQMDSKKGQNTPRGNQSSRMSQQDKPSYYRTRYVSTTSQHYMLPVDGQARNTRNIHTKINPTNQNEFK